ncbi:MAG: hypothetical protein EBZ59_09780 [Planctomycetia bacterium]|nr:hypothetical protein [Planctomycetia bacterium]
MIVNVLLLAVFLAVTGLLFREGLWSALVMLPGVLLAASLATAWFETLSGAIENVLPSYCYLLDFLSMWAIFCIVLLACREATDRVSRSRVVYRRPVEMVGSILVSAVVGWVMVAFTAASLHTAALPRDAVQPTPESRMLFGLAPDRKWLSWVRNASRAGPFSRAANAFDRDADFILRYANRRQKLEAEESLRVSFP